MNPADGHRDSKSGFLSFDFLSAATLEKEMDSAGNDQFDNSVILATLKDGLSTRPFLPRRVCFPFFGHLMSPPKTVFKFQMSSVSHERAYGKDKLQHHLRENSFER